MSNQLLKDYINQNCFENITDSIVTLIEPDKNSSLKNIKLLKIPNDLIILKGDVFQLNTIFGDGKDYIKRCDYLIISNDTLFFIELKSHENAPTIKKKIIIDQFKTVECIVDLIDSVISRFSNRSFRLNKLKRKFFLFYHNPTLSKTRTSSKESYVKYQSNSSKNFHSIPVQNGEDIYFKEIN